MIFLALIVRHYYLIQPLPSRLKVQPLSPSIAPKPSKKHYENEQSFDKAVKLFQGRFQGAGNKKYIFNPMCIAVTALVKFKQQQS